MYRIVFFVLCNALVAAALAQKAPVFKVEISSDSILLGNYFSVCFTLENAPGRDFQPPVFEGFRIVRGPNVSSSTRIVNGEVFQKIAYTFYLEPKDIGNYYIEPASIQAGEQLLETQPRPVLVVPNPDGIIQQAEPPHSIEPQWQARPMLPKSEEPKPKRKTYKI